MLILVILLWTAFLLWLILAVYLVWAMQGGTILRPNRVAVLPEPPPRVSILIPARNEEEALPAALQSIVALDYPNYEVIVVDDGSTDSSGRIADEWSANSASHGRVRVIHNKELPPGWAGKVHALALAAAQATGEWILATDADVLFHRNLLKLAVSLAIEKEARLVSVIPEIETGHFWERVVLPAFSLLLGSLFPLRLVNRPGSRRALAAGAFILMKCRDYEEVGGYEAIKNVVIEDLRMAELFKRHGRRVYLAVSRGLFTTRMYSSAHELWEGLSRSAFEGTGYSVAKSLGGVVIGVWVGVFPWIVAACFVTQRFLTGHPANRQVALVAALAACMMSAVVYLPFIIFIRVPVAYVFTLPLAALFYSGVTLNSMWRSHFGSGVPWKGRHYRSSR